ncbi:MAG: Response regulator PleD [Smithella sp. PtaU1.Bin162]|nr:MAG: Response regulator PleD [Smithella sp. PtaU1.Bin162]
MSGRKILIIDDEEKFCRAIKKALELKTDFQVLTATEGLEGVRLAKTQKPDVVLLDVMMPGMFGTDVAEKLSDDPATSSIPIIFVTAIIKQEEVEAKNYIAGGHSFIAKPVIIDDVIKKINEVL